MTKTKEVARKCVSKKRLRELKALFNAPTPPDLPDDFSDSPIVYEAFIPATGRILRRVFERSLAHRYCNTFNSMNFLDEPEHHAEVRERRAVLYPVDDLAAALNSYNGALDKVTAAMRKAVQA